MAAPVPFTCPDVNRVLTAVGIALKMALNGTRDFPEARTLFTDIISTLEDVPGILEELRQANDQLRRWGEKFENEVKELYNQLDELKSIGKAKFS